MTKKIIIVIGWIFLSINLITTFASSNANLYLVFDKTTYNTGDVVSINFNLDNFSGLNEIKLQLKIKEEYFEPIMENDKYFFFNASSICTNDVVNDYIDNSYLRLRLLKPDVLEEGYYSSYKNNLCSIKLLVKKPIDDIYKYFSLDDYENMGISLYLFDIKDSLIEYNLNYKEKIKINWEKETYEVEVFDNVPNFKEDIKVLNREDTEYEFLIEKELDTHLIGLKTVHIGIYDKSAADYTILSKVVNVVDKTAPIVLYEDEVMITDSSLDSFVFEDILTITDNYDSMFNINKIYYDESLELVDDLRDYLSKETVGYVKFVVEDMSKNSFATELIKVIVDDTTAPNVNIIEAINILDTEINEFELESLFKISDSYDENPMLIFDFKEYNNYSMDEIKEFLKLGYEINFGYFATDDDGNKTEEIACKVFAIDTTKPYVIVSDQVVKDTEFDSLNFDLIYKVEDNFYFPCQVIKKYYINEVEVTFNEFKEKIFKGYTGLIKYEAIDVANNKSEDVIQKITIVDTTNPFIIIKNIKDGEKYVNLEKIEYEVMDNFDGYVTTVLLDNNPYLDEKVEIGEHVFTIKVVDTSGNENSVSVNFFVIEDNIIGCGDDASCYVNNYLEIVIIVSSLLLFVVILIVVRIFIMKTKRRNN